MSMRSRWAAALFIMLLAFSFLAGQHFERARAERASVSGLAQVLTSIKPAASHAENDGAPSAVSATAILEEALSDLRSQYVEKLEGPAWERKLGYGAIRGMLAALADPYTRFMEPEEHQAFQRENEGHFDGIGATITMMEVPAKQGEKELSRPVQCPYCGSFLPEPKHERVAIQAPLRNSPAAKAGLRPRDLILAIDGKSTQGMDLGTAVRLIRGRAGTKVTLTIGREGATGPIEKVITRGVIDVPAVDVKMPERPGDVGVLTINTFNERTPAMALDAIKRLQAAKAGGLVIDLRDCPGGLFSAAMQVGRLFVEQGRPVVYVQERGRERRPQPADGGGKGPVYRGPLAVLVNGGSASASEILAGAIQDYGLGTVVGEPTWGKGVVQTVLPLEDGSALVLTTAKYFTPDGRDINKTSERKGGIIPDKVVTVPKDVALTYVRLTDKDPQYVEAVKILRRQMAQTPRRASRN